MARTVTLAKLRGLARLYADQRPGGATAFVPDTDGGAQDVGSVNDLVNLAIAEFYDLLIAARGASYYKYNHQVAILPAPTLYPDYYPLPLDFYQALGLSLLWGPSEIESVPELTRPIESVNLSNLSAWGKWLPKAFCITDSIYFYPKPASNVTLSLDYIPTAPMLAFDGSTIDCVNGWEKLPALRVAMELRTIEEMPFGDLERLFDREQERIIRQASERQAAAPRQVQDVQPEGGSGGWPFVRRRDP